MGAVMVEEDFHQRRHLLGAGRRPGGRHGLGDQRAGAEPHHMAQGGGVDGGAAARRQHGVGGAQKVGRGVHQGAVQVEDQGRSQWACGLR